MCVLFVISYEPTIYMVAGGVLLQDADRARLGAWLHEPLHRALCAGPHASERVEKRAPASGRQPSLQVRKLGYSDEINSQVVGYSGDECGAKHMCVVCVFLYSCIVFRVHLNHLPTATHHQPLLTPHPNHFNHPPLQPPYQGV